MRLSRITREDGEWREIHRKKERKKEGKTSKIRPPNSVEQWKDLKCFTREIFHKAQNIIAFEFFLWASKNIGLFQFKRDEQYIILQITFRINNNFRAIFNYSLESISICFLGLKNDQKCSWTLNGIRTDVFLEFLIRFNYQ